MKPEDLVGRLLGGRYRIERLIGSGGFGAVYKATHVALARPVAIKTCLHASPAMHARFVQEARLQARLRHPRCVTLLEFGEEPDGIFYMVQEFVEGQNLSQILRTHGPLAPGRALAVTAEVLDALHAAHRLGVVHRDIKPSNVMLTRDIDDQEEVRLIDFGIAKAVEETVEGESLTHTGAMLGTPSYMAPEQIRHEPIGPTTDLYAVGAMLYRLCAGHGPFDAPFGYEILRMHLFEPPPSLPFHAPALDAVIARAMAKAPADRYPSAQAMRAAIEALDGLDGIGSITMSERTLDDALPPGMRPAPTDGTLTNARGEIDPASRPTSPRPGRRAAVIALVALAAALVFWPTAPPP
ncbi:MAG: serine/threonine-protein kinase, partial [bacterium]